MLCADCKAPVLRDGGMGRPRKRCQVCYEKRLRDKWAAEGERRRALTGTASAEVFSKEEVFGRDGWICGICSGPVDRSLQWPHPQSASLDHIIPIGLGGLHTRENCQCSHLGCNTAKGGVGVPQEEGAALVPPLASAPETSTPLEYMLRIMNDPNASELRRDRAAIASAPYCHPRLDRVTQSKKDEAAKDAKDAGTGKFATPEPPKLIVNNR